MSFNIRGGLGSDGRRSLERVAGTILAAGPDLVALQEVHRWLPWSGFGDQPRRLAWLTSLRVLFRGSFWVGSGAFGNAWLTRWPCAGVRRCRLTSGREPRAALCLDLEFGGQLVRAIGTHFGLGAEEKAAQARQMAEMVAAATGPVLLLGDLNATPDSAEVACLLAAGLRHAVPPEFPTFPATTPRARIDYVLASEHWESHGGGVPESLASDHRPVIAELSLRE
jgi:endonuclease/exonuclease/phosphatase family metal-dependent hydrolase